jgi:hypothetical protein
MAPGLYVLVNLWGLDRKGVAIPCLLRYPEFGISTLETFTFGWCEKREIILII